MMRRGRASSSEWIDAVFCGGGENGSGDSRGAGDGNVQAGRQRSNGGGNGHARELVGGADAAGLSPADVDRRVCPPRAARRATDDAQLVERLGQKVTIVPGSPMNIKITTKEDLRIAAAAQELAEAETCGSRTSVCR